MAQKPANQMIDEVVEEVKKNRAEIKKLRQELDAIKAQGNPGGR